MWSTAYYLNRQTAEVEEVYSNTFGHEEYSQSDNYLGPFLTREDAEARNV